MHDRDIGKSLTEEQLTADQLSRAGRARVSFGRFVDRFRGPIIPRLAVGVSGGALAIAVFSGTIYLPDVLSVDSSTVASSSEGLKSSDSNPELSPELEQKLEVIFNKTKKDIAAEIVRVDKGNRDDHLSGSPQEVIEWFNGLDAKQKAAVFMYGLMALYTLRAAGRYSRAFIDPRSDIVLRDSEGKIDLKNFRSSVQVYVKNNFGNGANEGEDSEQKVDRITTQERLHSLEHTIVTDPQNRRTAIALGGFTTASVIGADAGEMGSIELNLTLVIASLLASIQPPFKAFDRFREKLPLEIIQKTAPFFAGSLYGIVGAGLYFGSKDIAVLNAYLAASTFATLFAYADMGIGSREYLASFIDTLNLPEELRRFHVLLISKRVPHIDRQIFEALVEGRVEDAIFKGTVQLDERGNPSKDEAGNFIRNTPLLDEAFNQLEKAFKEDDPYAELDVPLPALKEQVSEAIREFMGNTGTDNENSQKNNTRNARRRRSRGVLFRK